MKSLDNATGCFLWTPGHLRPELYGSHTFYCVRKVVVAINSLSAPVSVVGNGLILVAMLKTRSLHTTANILIGSLLLADLAIGSVVQTLMVSAMLTDNFNYSCLFVDSLTYIAVSIGSISATTMAVVSCERYIALFFSMRYTVILTNRRAYIAASSIWIGWLSLCSLPFAGIPLLQTLKTLIENVIYSLAFITILFSYVKIFSLVRRHRRQIQQQLSAALTASAKNQLKQTKLAITMSYVIGISFLCYLPSSLVLAMFVASPEPNIILFNVFFLVMSIQLMRSCVNPVIYCWRSQEIRRPTFALMQSCKERLCCCR